MPRRTTDSYTGQPYIEDYISPFKGINAPITLFKKNHRSAGEYRATHVPEENGWIVSRSAQPARALHEIRITFDPLCECEARRLLDVLVAHDGTIARGLHKAFTEGDFEVMQLFEDLIARCWPENVSEEANVHMGPDQ